MSDLSTQFATAAEEVQKLTRRPDNDTLLKLYGLYKQASVGDVTGSRPGFLDVKGRAKYDAWASLQGLPQDDARQSYIDLVAELKQRYS